MTHVLIIEDDPDVRESVAEVLGEAGMAVDAAPNGRVGLDMLRAGLRPEVIVLDLMMPVMDGREFREHQLADAKLKSIPVVVVTADGRPPAFDVPVAAVIKKPFIVERLIGAIERARQASSE